MGGHGKGKISKYILEILVLLFSLVYFIPLWMLIVNSFKTRIEASELKLNLPKVFMFENYAKVFAEADVLKSAFNGLLVAGSTLILTAIISSMCAFTIARRNDRMTNFFYNLFASGVILSVAMIPTFLLFSVLKMINTYQGEILAFTAYALPLSSFLYTGFMKTVPRGLDEAAIVDGCGKLTLFFKIIFPLLKPITVTVGIFNFIGVWNDVQTQVFLVSPDKWSMPMMVYRFYGKYLLDWNIVFADIVITLIPILIVYVFAQKYIISGMTAGALKG